MPILFAVRGARALLVMSLVAFTLPSRAAAQRHVVAPELVGGIPIVPVDRATNSGQLWLHVRNTSTTDVLPISLGLSSFVNRTTGRTLSTQATFFKGSATSGTPYFEDTLRPGQVLPVRVQVSNVDEAGESVAQLTYNGRSDSIRAWYYDLPFGVSIQSATSNKPTLLLQRGRDGSLVLKNDDAFTYRVVWRLLIPGAGDVREGTVTLSPKSSLPITISPAPSWFTKQFEGFFRDDARNGFLSLRFVPGPQRAGGDLAVKTLPIELRLAFRSDLAKAVAVNGVLFILLLIGGVTSFVLSLWFPSKLAQADLTRSLGELAQTTHEISAKTDSSLRVAVRVERLRLSERLERLSAFSADTPALLTQTQKEIEVLRRRVEVICLLDAIAQQLDTLRGQAGGAPYTLLKRAARSLATTAKVLLNRSVSEGALKQAETDLRSVSDRLDRIEKADPEFAQELATRVEERKKDFDEKGSNNVAQFAKCKELRPKLQDLFEVVRNDNYATPANITPRDYHWIDSSTEKLDVLKRYIIRFESIASDPERQRRVAEQEPSLVHYLTLQSWQALELARRTRNHIEENVFAADVEKELRSERIRVQRDQIAVYENEPIHLHAKFDDSTLDASTARLDFVCVWDFGAVVGQEEGWDIVHYFRNPAESVFSVTFRRLSGEWLMNGHQRIELHEQIPVADRPNARVGTRKDAEAKLQRIPIGDRAKVEALRLVVARGVAAIALLAGAREQLLKLDLVAGLIAAFLIGFGADSMKNVLTKRSP